MCIEQVIAGILVPFSIIGLDFKSKEELQQLPQTVEERIEELEEDGQMSCSYSESLPDLEGVSNRIEVSHTVVCS